MAETTNPEKVMPIIEHLRELRSCILGSFIALVVAFILCFIFSNSIIRVFTEQFATVASSINNKLVATSIAEGFITQVQIAVIAGITISMPVHIFNILRFAFPGLTLRQRKIILAVLSASLVLIVFGAYLGYFLIVPAAVSFLTNPTFLPKGVGYLLNYQTNVFYVLSFILWSLLAMQTPLVLEVLLMLGILKRKKVFKATRFVIVLIFVFAAIVTPSPDFVSQLGIALPLIVLYFLAILIAKIFKFGEE